MKIIVYSKQDHSFDRSEPGGQFRAQRPVRLGVFGPDEKGF
jgi:hypothetical protein